MQSSGSLSQVMFSCLQSLGELCMLPGSPDLTDNIATPLAQMQSLNRYLVDVFSPVCKLINLFCNKQKRNAFAFMHVLQFLLRINFFTCRNFRRIQRNTVPEWHPFSIYVKCFFMTVMLVLQKQSVTLSSRLHAIWTEGGGTFVQCQWKGDLSKFKMPTN